MLLLQGSLDLRTWLAAPGLPGRTFPLGTIRPALAGEPQPVICLFGLLQISHPGPQASSKMRVFSKSCFFAGGVVPSGPTMIDKKGKSGFRELSRSLERNNVNVIWVNHSLLPCWSRRVRSVTLGIRCRGPTAYFLNPAVKHSPFPARSRGLAGTRTVYNRFPLVPV